LIPNRSKCEDRTMSLINTKWSLVSLVASPFITSALDNFHSYNRPRHVNYSSIYSNGQSLPSGNLALKQVTSAVDCRQRSAIRPNSPKLELLMVVVRIETVGDILIFFITSVTLTSISLNPNSHSYHGSRAQWSRLDDQHHRWEAAYPSRSNGRFQYTLH